MYSPVGGASIPGAKNQSQTLAFSAESIYCINANYNHLHVRHKNAEWHFTYTPKLYRPSHHAIDFNGLQFTLRSGVCGENTKRDDGSPKYSSTDFVTIPFDKNTMYVSSRIMPAYLIPVLLNILYKLYKRSPGLHKCNSITNSSTRRGCAFQAK